MAESETACHAAAIFQRTERLLGADALAVLARTRVILFGVGGVGGWCAESLVRSGVGHLTIVDSDCVCVSNVNRQAMATTQTVGAVKVDAMAARLHDINPVCDVVARREVYSPETAAAFDVGSYDYVVDAIDSLANKAHLLVHATSFARPTLFASMGAALKTDPFRIRKAEFWKIAGDPLARALRGRLRKAGVKPAKKVMCVYSDEPPHPNRGAAAVVPPSPADDGDSWSVRKAQINGTVAHVPAMFGFALAGLVVNDVSCATL